MPTIDNCNTTHIYAVGFVAVRFKIIILIIRKFITCTWSSINRRLSQAVAAAVRHPTMILQCMWVVAPVKPDGHCFIFEVWQVNKKEELFGMCLWYRCWCWIKNHWYQWYRWVTSIQYRYRSRPVCMFLYNYQVQAKQFALICLYRSLHTVALQQNVY